MGRKQEKEIIKHVTLEELNKIIEKEEKSVRVLERGSSLFHVGKLNSSFPVLR